MDVALLSLVMVSGLTEAHNHSAWLSRFPPEKLCEKNWHIASAYVDRLDCEHAAAGASHTYWAEALRAERVEAARLKAAWYALWWIVWPNANACQRSEWEDILRGHIGDRAFVTGEWPPPLPAWYWPARR